MSRRMLRYSLRCLGKSWACHWDRSTRSVVGNDGETRVWVTLRHPVTDVWSAVGFTQPLLKLSSVLEMQIQNSPELVDHWGTEASQESRKQQRGLGVLFSKEVKWRDGYHENKVGKSSTSSWVESHRSVKDYDHTKIRVDSAVPSNWFAKADSQKCECIHLSPVHERY